MNIRVLLICSFVILTKIKDQLKCLIVKSYKTLSSLIYRNVIENILQLYITLYYKSIKERQYYFILHDIKDI